ncbi:MAG: hypothetical protein E7307_14075 [Butyrivibrio sp.]|nr:hypothetical protein [Butyrivibrio sp.]
MKLRRSVPAVGIWVLFLIFEIGMVASVSFFSGLFPYENKLVYSLVFTGISILIMSLVTFLLGKLCDRIDMASLKDNVWIHVVYALLAGAIIIGSIVYREYLFENYTGGLTGKLSLFDNAMISGDKFTPEYDLLSNVYSFILRLILFFTGNRLPVAFYFQMGCFVVFMICAFFTVKMLLGWAASIVFTAYVAFVPIFTVLFTGAEISTDYLFMAMFGIELLFVALFLKKAYRGGYKSYGWIIWFLFVGVIVGFMAYVDAGTIIMILPFIIATLFIYGRTFGQSILSVLMLLLGAGLTFVGMLVQERGFMMADVSFKDWAAYYFHNLNTFSMFWTYTDHKILYLVTVVAMAGIIFGFWRNRNFERVSPWLLSLIFIFATVPFMGATRMNTQAFVTLYYAFILGCVASLIATPSYEDAEYVEPDIFREITEPLETDYEEVKEPDAPEKEEEEPRVIRPEKPSEYEFEDEPEQAYPEEAKEPGTPEESEEPEEPAAFTEEPKPEEPETPAEEAYAEPAPEKEAAPKPRFVPEGMVLPTDDDDETPRMNMARPKTMTGLGTDGRKLHINRPGDAKPDSGKASAPAAPKDDFDIAFTEGDDFDI